jgi:hypothetical protein
VQVQQMALILSYQRLFFDLVSTHQSIEQQRLDFALMMLLLVY